MKDLYFKVIITTKIALFNEREMYSNPCHELWFAENEEKLINVVYKPCYKMDEENFVKTIKKALRRRYKECIIQQVDYEKLIEAQRA